MPNDFDRMLNRGVERRLTLSRNDQSVSSSLWQQLNNDNNSKVASLTTSPSTTSTIKPSKSLKANKASSSAKSPSTPSPSQRSPPKSAPTPQDDQGKLGNGRPGIFKKSIRRVKSGNEQREKAKKQREVSMDFEIQTASGVSSGANSPQDSFHRESDEKWMDILIANGARPMNRDVHLQPSPPRPEQDRSSTGSARQIITPINDMTPTATAFGGLNVAAEGHGNHPVLGSPMQLGRQGSGASSSGHVENDFEPSSDFANAFGNNTDTHSQSSMYDDGSHRSSVLTADDDNSVQPSDSISMRRRARESPPPEPAMPDDVLPSPTVESNRNTAHLAYDEIVSPKPRMVGERDAIFSIVDHYGDARASQGTDSNNSDDAYGGINRDSVIEQTYAAERVNSAYGGIEQRDSVIEETYASERINSAYSIDDTFPPPPIFDLTPGREPSPARYKHGEPLQFGKSFLLGCALLTHSRRRGGGRRV